MLNGSDTRRLMTIVSGLPQAGNPDKLRDLLRNVLLTDSPEIDAVLGNLGIPDAPMDAALAVVSHLRNEGQYAPGRSYLLDLVAALAELTRKYDDREFLDALAKRLAVAGAARPDRPSLPAPAPLLADEEYRGTDDATSRVSVLEKVIDENTLRPFYYLRLGLEAGDGVCQILAPTGTGTGFLIAPNLILTNHHVIGSADILRRTEILFRFRKNPNGTYDRAISVEPEPEGTFAADPRPGLDAAVFTLTPDSAESLVKSGIHPLTLSNKEVTVGDRVAIIQHAAGLPLQVALQNNRVQYADEAIVDYTTTTLPGSSGSPVFNDEFHVVALHREGGTLQQPNNGLYYYRNRGTSSIALLHWLRRAGLPL
jgi:V8-like Glu-specific endopeptidase